MSYMSILIFVFPFHSAVYCGVSWEYTSSPVFGHVPAYCGWS